MTSIFERREEGVHVLREEPPRERATQVVFVSSHETADALTFEELCAARRGAIVFAKPALDDLAAFAATVRARVKRHGAALSLLWLDASRRFSEPLVLTAGNNVAGPFAVSTANQALIIGRGCVAEATSSGFTVTGEPGGPGTISLVAGYGLATFAVDQVTIGVTGTDWENGTFSFPVETDSVNGFAALDINIQYWVDDPDWPGWGRLRALRFPLANPGLPAAMKLPFLISPHSTWAIELYADQQAQPFASTFLSWAGPVTLTPGAPDASGWYGFVHQPSPPGPAGGPYDPLFFSPTGPWAIGSSANLVAGLAGSEYFANPSVLHFADGRPGYAPSIGSIGGGTSGGGTALLPFPATAWANVTTGSGDGTLSLYYTQPPKASFYQIPDSGDAGLEYLEIPASQTAGALYPMVPFGGVSRGDLPLAEALEQQVLSTVRKQVINPSLQVPSPNVGALPQGMYGLFTQSDDAGGGIQIALTVGQSGEAITFENVRGNLLTDLQSSQLFLVVSDYAALTNCCTLPATDAIPIDGFTFDLFDETQWTSGPAQTVMLFKFAKGPLASLIANLNAWTDAATFAANNDVPGGVAGAGTQQFLLAGIAQAQGAYAAGATEYAYFVETILTDPHWTGLLFFNVVVTAGNLPALLQAGLPPALLAQHFGIAITPLAVDASSPTPFSNAADSTCFGVVAYEAPADLTYDGNLYAYQVLELAVLFEASALISFTASIELLVTELFGEEVTLQGGVHGNNLVFIGTGATAASTNLSFAIAGPAVFTVSSAVLDEIEVVSAQLMPSPTTPGDYTFAFAGNLAFRAFAFDLFSYDRLAFSNATIAMTVADGAVTFPSGAFDASALALNLQGSTVRAGSLFASMPIRPGTFLQVTSGATPASLGYAGVAAPIPEGTLAATWYGLVSTLSLGSAGALASGAPFAATLLTAWSPSPWTPGTAPSTAQPNVAIGMILPGAGQGTAPATSLQGVLQLSWGDLSFDVASPGGSYVLEIAGVALQLFGVRLPPFGQTRAYLFGAPATATSPSIGWYLGYAAG